MTRACSAWLKVLVIRARAIGATAVNDLALHYTRFDDQTVILEEGVDGVAGDADVDLRAREVVVFAERFEIVFEP